MMDFSKVRVRNIKEKPMVGSTRKKNKPAPADFQVRIGDVEMGRIFHLRDSLDQSETLIQCADHYREMEWVMEARGEGVASLDFSEPSEVWGERLMTLSLAGVSVDLGIKTGLASRLLVLETPRGETILDTYGEWRSPCRAQAGQDWEQHYFLLPPASRVPTSGELENFHVRVYGQGGLVLAPPSRRREGDEFWTWLAPPWEVPPDPPGRPVWEFLEDFSLLQEAGALDLAKEVLSWDQVYALIAPHTGLVRTLLTPAVSVAAYYRQLAHQAQQAGITQAEVVFALLWHAPQGDARTSTERLAFIQKLAAAAKAEEGGGQGQGRSASASASPSPDRGGVAPGTAGSPGEAQSRPHDLVEFMENRVVLDRSRYESMIYELAELTAKAEALQRRLQEWEQRYEKDAPAEVREAQEIYQASGATPMEFPFDPPPGSSLPGQKRKPLSSLKSVAQEFLKNNADLAADDESVRMLQFCLRNYIDLNPELNALPLKEKLEMAGKMARDFLNQVCHRGRLS
jgi:hypothetical protein